MANLNDSEFKSLEKYNSISINDRRKLFLDEGYPSTPITPQAYNSFTVFEDFDRGSGSWTTGHMTNFVSVGSTGVTLSDTNGAFQNDITGTLGNLSVNFDANAATGSYMRYVLNRTNGRSKACFINGYKAEYRFVLEADVPTRVVVIGWMSTLYNAANYDADGSTQGYSGFLIKNRDIYFANREINGSFLRKDLIGTLSTGQVYVLAVDTTNGQLVYSITNSTTSTVEFSGVLNKWTGFSGAVINDMFGTAPSDPKHTLGLGLQVTLTGANGATQLTRVFTIDSFFLTCPKIR